MHGDHDTSVQAQKKKAILVPSCLSDRHLQEMAEMARQVQGNHSTEKGDLSQENAQILQELASNFLWKKPLLKPVTLDFLSFQKIFFNETSSGALRTPQRHFETGDTVDSKQHKMTP